jgi:hypothetical protein
LPAVFTFAVTAATTNGSAVRDVTVNWGDGSPTEDLGALTGTTTVSHVYQTAGSFRVSALLTDSSGNTVNPATTVTVVPTVSPTIIVTVQSISPTSGHPATVTFQIQVTAPSGVGIQDSVISWGDGSTQHLGGISGTITLSHTYNAAGTFSVQLTVTDTLNRSNIGSTSVTIS